MEVTMKDKDEPTLERFEEFVVAALRVDPKGLSGKRGREASEEPSNPSRS
jgi:hypothetical protein